MSWIGIVVALAIIIGIMIDTFEVVILPRRVRHGYRLARVYYRYAWLLWGKAALLLPQGWLRYGFLGTFGPMSLFGLITVWAAGLIAGFALLHWSLNTALVFPDIDERGVVDYFYFSGTTFFTLGYGDIVPVGVVGRMLSIAEAGIGFAFLAVVLSYLPVIYQTFSRREVTISLLDARAGSPPTAGELLRRLAMRGGAVNSGGLLSEWERWAAELLESHISFPVLRFYRSQHDNQSWVAALTTMLDTTAVLIANAKHADDYQARLTFAMARHAAVDLGLVAQLPPLSPPIDRLPPERLARLLESLRAAGLEIRDEPQVASALTELRALYEPFVYALGENLQFTLPPFLPADVPIDNWQTSPWMQRSPDLGALPAARGADEHFH
ncbi:MAG: two pore domain potassium channel family protein [Pirellula sp.]|nr:two pore domain potassium channel family protein [Pirellula sp.]